MEKRTPRSGEKDAIHLFQMITLKALENGAVLAIHRHDTDPRLFCLAQKNLASHHQGLFVGQGNLFPRPGPFQYRNKPGASYNRSGDTRYTLPALKGDPRYDTMYAEGNSIAGGFEGLEPAIAEADLSRAQTALQQGLAQAAQSALAAQIPAGYLAVPGTLEITYSDISQTAGDNNTATLSQTATMQAAIVKIDDLAHAVAKIAVEGYEGEAVTFADPVGVAISATEPEEEEGTLSLTLSGDLTLQWRYDPNALKDALVGKQKKEFEAIIQSFNPAITRAEAKIRPFWDSSFPDDPEKVEIVAGLQ